MMVTIACKTIKFNPSFDIQHGESGSYWGVQREARENLKVVWAEFSTLS
jgi:hypothetical protein